MAESDPKDALIGHLRQDFAKLSHEIRTDPCVFCWAALKRPVQEEVWDFVERYNELRFHYIRSDLFPPESWSVMFER